MLSGKVIVHQRDLFVQAFMKKKVFTTVYDTILFLYSIYNQFHPVTKSDYFSFQTLFMRSLIFQCIWKNRNFPSVARYINWDELQWQEASTVFSNVVFEARSLCSNVFTSVAACNWILRQIRVDNGILWGFVVFPMLLFSEIFSCCWLTSLFPSLHSPPFRPKGGQQVLSSTQFPTCLCLFISLRSF